MNIKQNEHVENYMDMQEILLDLRVKMTKEDISSILEIKKSDLILLFHHRAGRNIRNYYRLWEKENPYTDNSDAQSKLRADNFSNIVINKLWEMIYKEKESEDGVLNLDEFPGKL